MGLGIHPPLSLLIKTDKGKTASRKGEVLFRYRYKVAYMHVLFLLVEEYHTQALYRQDHIVI